MMLEGPWTVEQCHPLHSPEAFLDSRVCKKVPLEQAGPRVSMQKGVQLFFQPDWTKSRGTIFVKRTICFKRNPRLCAKRGTKRNSLTLAAGQSLWLTPPKKRTPTKHLPYMVHEVFRDFQATHSLPKAEQEKVWNNEAGQPLRWTKGDTLPASC